MSFHRSMCINPKRCALRPLLVVVALFTPLTGCDVKLPESGVPLALAEERRAVLSDLSYDLTLTIPESRSGTIEGTVTVRMNLSSTRGPLVLDFDTDAGRVHRVLSHGKEVRHTTGNGHIAIPGSALKEGAQEIAIEFTGSDAALNRQERFLYSLFVPDRAPTAFPCFNQPDLKARYSLRLTVPGVWEAISNGAVLDRRDSSGVSTFTFAQTEPISTYIFAFAAGEFLIEEAVRQGRTMRMFHRETDSSRVRRNRDAIFDLHAAALQWLEEYTGIAYPFGKFDFLAVPAFQFGGMEHPGAIWYREASLFLEESPTTNQLLGRASLIAHETAHMWFGNLVTMEWFNDVWMKEVFANFMAAKIVAPSFPDLNHDLRFLLAHHPAAYEVDRTAGANPIRQQLDNINRAASLYGAIIYQKAPVVLKQLEKLIGESAFRDGVRRYLTDFSFGNATWPDLISILDELTDEDLAEWSRVWVEVPGRPRIAARVVPRDPTALRELTVEQSDPRDRVGHRVTWNQRFTVALGYGGSVRSVDVHLRSSESTSNVVSGWPIPDYVLPGSDGVAYGHFALDRVSRAWLLMRLPEIQDPLVRSSAWLALWEDVLEGRVHPAELVGLAQRALPLERDELIAQHVLSLLGTTWWRYLDGEWRDTLASVVEGVLWGEVERSATPSRRRAFLDAYVSLVVSADGVQRVERIWRMTERVPGLTIGEEQYIDMAKALAVRDVPGADEILRVQRERITNPDRRARFEFVVPALAADRGRRDSVFASFAALENRRREAWVLEAQSALNHPLRRAQSIDYVMPSLELLEEIERTGDIFFPQRWLAATLGGHYSPAAAHIVRTFLMQRPEYPARLRDKILQASHHLMSAG